MSKYHMRRQDRQINDEVELIHTVDFAAYNDYN